MKLSIEKRHSSTCGEQSRTIAVLFLLAVGLFVSGAGGDKVKIRRSMPSGLVHHWKLDDDTNSTTLLDSVGDNNATFVYDSCDVNTAGKIGGAISFSLADSYINTGIYGNTFFDSNCTVAFWIKPSDGQPFQIKSLVNDGYIDLPEDCFAFRLLTDGKLKVIYKNVLSITSSAVFTDGQQDWHFVAVSLQQIGSSVYGYLYFDGVLVGSGNVVNQMSTYIPHKLIYLGMANGGPNYYFVGVMDDIRFYNRALSQAEVTYLWNNGVGRE